MEFFKNNIARIYHDLSSDTLYLEYLGKVPNDASFITVNQAVLDAFTKLKTQKFVADIRKMGIISLDAQKWVLSNLLPGMVKHLKGRKLYHAQLLDPSEILSKVSGGNIKNKSTQLMEGIEVIQFTDEKDLLEYLRGINNPS